MPPTKEGKEKDTEDVRKVRVRITHSSKDLKALERVTNSLIENAKKKQNDGVTFRGPVRVPTKTLRITCRKTPCGEGSKTWDRWELRIYKRYIDFFCLEQDIKELTNLKVDPGVEITLEMAD